MRTGVATQVTDAALQDALNQQNGSVAAQQVTSDALASIDAAQGTVAAGNDLSSRLGALTDAFTTLGTNSANQAQQAAVVSAASTMAGGIRDQAAAYAAARQGAQNGLVTDVAALNTAIGTIGSLSQQIIATAARGESTADLESQRDAQEATAAQLGGLRFLPQSNGDVTAVAGGIVVDTHAATGPFSIATASLATGSSAPPLMLSGNDVTTGITGGSIGARITLRDTTVPQAEAGLDEFAATLANRINSQGLNLFTDPAGNPPATGGTPIQSGYIGFATDVQVNPAVTAAPSLVRDGTQSVANGTGGAAAFTPNPVGGPTGSTTLINRVLLYGFGSQAQSGTPQRRPTRPGLAPTARFHYPMTRARRWRPSRPTWLRRRPRMRGRRRMR